MADNSKIFTSAEFTRNLSTFAQIMRFAGVGAHHHNGIGHCGTKHPKDNGNRTHDDASCSPSLASNCGRHTLAFVSQPRSFLGQPHSRSEDRLMPRRPVHQTRWEQRKLNNLHIWGCPVYMLDKMISDGKKLPRWTPRSTRTINMGFSPKHAITIPIVLNPQTGCITPQFHVVFDDWFATLPASVDDLPNFNADSWK